MDTTATEMTKQLELVINSPWLNKKDGNKDGVEISLVERIHAYMFVYDGSNKRTFDSMFCMLETILELEKSKKRGGGVKSGGKKGGDGLFIPKKIIIANKKDLKRNKEAGTVGKEDIKKLEGIKIKEVSALTN